MSSDQPSTSPAAGGTDRHLALLGGWRRPATAPVPTAALHAALIGGANLDLTGSAFPGDGSTITSVSVVGGVDVKVPAGTRVFLRQFRVIGPRKLELGEAEPGGPVLRLRVFTLWGGVHVHH